ncbi:hypothetical protein Hanom_Chr03g00255411 [Helianthus anomalus]
MMCGLIDLKDDTVEVYASPSVTLSLFPKTTSSYPTPVVCSLELWHACAGPLVSLPKKENAVVYLPQGHLEQHRIYDSPLITGVNLPPHVFLPLITSNLFEKGLPPKTATMIERFHVILRDLFIKCNPLFPCDCTDVNPYCCTDIHLLLLTIETIALL